MGQQISTDDALPVYRQTCGELFDSNLLLRAQVALLERQVTALQEENQRLQQAAGEGPGLGSAPAEQAPDGDHADFDQQYHLER